MHHMGMHIIRDVVFVVNHILISLYWFDVCPHEVLNHHSKYLVDNYCSLLIELGYNEQSDSFSYTK